jgi:hypothetical protein
VSLPKLPREHIRNIAAFSDENFIGQLAAGNFHCWCAINDPLTPFIASFVVYASCRKAENRAWR